LQAASIVGLETVTANILNGTEVFSGTNTFNGTISGNTISANTISAGFFAGDGSALTNLPGGAGGGSWEVNTNGTNTLYKTLTAGGIIFASISAVGLGAVQASNTISAGTISAGFFAGDGSALTNLPGGGGGGGGSWEVNTFGSNTFYQTLTADSIVSASISAATLTAVSNVFIGTKGVNSLFAVTGALDAAIVGLNTVSGIQEASIIGLETVSAAQAAEITGLETATANILDGTEKFSGTNVFNGTISGDAISGNTISAGFFAGDATYLTNVPGAGGGSKWKVTGPVGAKLYQPLTAEGIVYTAISAEGLTAVQSTNTISANTISAGFFAGDGSALTNVPGGGGGAISGEAWSVSTVTNGVYYQTITGGYGVQTKFNDFTAAAGTPHTIDSFATGTENFRTIEYTLSLSFGEYRQSQKLMIMHTTSSAFSESYAIMYEPGLICSTSAYLDAGVVYVQVVPETGVNGTTTYNYVRNTFV
jgi:hypothetical protein